MIRSHRRLKFAIFGVCAASAVGGLVFSELNLALAALRIHLHATLGELQWVLNTYGIIVASTLVLFGRLGDVIGRKKLFMTALVLLALAMLITGMAHNIYVVIAAQALNGLSSAIIMPVSQAMVTNMYGESRRSKAIGLWAASTGIALGLGPIYSGFIIHALSWRWVFWLNVPMLAVSFVMVLLFAFDSRKKLESPRLDWLGSIILCVAMGCFVTVIVESQEFSRVTNAVLGFISMASFILLFVVESRVKQPIIREELFKNRAFLLASFCNCLLLFFIWADFFLLPLFLQNVLHYTPLHAGAAMLLVTIPLVIFSMKSQFFYDRFGPRQLIIVGFIFLVISSMIQYCFNAQISFGFIAMAALTFGIAWAMIWNPSATKAVSTLPLRDAGVASGTFVTFQEVGGSMGLAITGAVVRHFPSLAQGYPHGMTVLFCISALGLASAFRMQRLRDSLKAANMSH